MTTKAGTLTFETICPLCLERYPPNEIFIDGPYCPECSSEAIDHSVEPFQEYLNSKTVADFDQMLARWEARNGLRPEYKALVTRRIIDLRKQRGKT